MAIERFDSQINDRRRFLAARYFSICTFGPLIGTFQFYFLQFKWFKFILENSVGKYFTMNLVSKGSNENNRPKKFFLS